VPPLIFNLVDSAPGEESLSYLTPGLLEHLGLLYTGCSLDSLFLTTHKLIAKQLMRNSGIPTPDWICRDDDPGNFPPFARQWYLIKPASEDASIGITEESLLKAESYEAIFTALVQQQNKTAAPCFAERFINGREFAACIYGKADQPIVLPPYEWVFKKYDEDQKPRIFCYSSKWDENSYGYENIQANFQTAAADFPLVQSLADLARKCWSLFRLSGYARVDFRIDDEGRPWVLEINGNPSFYGFNNVARSIDLPFGTIVKAIVSAAGKQ
jgi:D-alanine-D-alanine ligase